MKIKLSNLKPDDIVWVCYDKNYGKGQEYISDIAVAKGIVKINEKREYIHSSPDHYNDNAYISVENFIKIQVPDMNGAIYEREYGDFYDERAQMTITNEICSNNPTIKMFVNKNDAIEYAKASLTKQYQNNLKTINKCQSDNKELLESIENLNNI